MLVTVQTAGKWREAQPIAPGKLGADVAVEKPPEFTCDPAFISETAEGFAGIPPC